MLKSLRKIGELQKGSGKSLPTKDVKPKGKGPHTFRLVIFDNDKKEVVFEDREFTENTPHEWNFMGNSDGNKPMDRLTTTSLEYILGFDDKGNLISSNKWILHAGQKIPVVGDKLKKVTQWYSPEHWKDKVEPDRFKTAVLFSIIVIDQGEKYELAKMQEYKEYFLVKQEDNNGEVKCQLCGRLTSIDDPGYPGGTLLKIYITDKKGFTSYISDSPENRLKTHVICNDCKNLLILGNNYVMDNMKVRVGKLNVYVIPSLSEKSNKSVLDRIKMEEEGWLVSFKELDEAENQIRDEAEFQDWIYSVTLVWGGAQKSKFAVSKVMYDVTIPRLMEIRRAAKNVEGRLDIKELTGKSLNVPSLYAITPVMETSRGIIATQFLNIMSSIMEGHPIDLIYVYSSFLKEIKCIRTDTCQNSLSSRLTLEEASLLATGFIKMLLELNRVSVQSMMGEASKLTDPKEYADKLGLAKGRKGLFLLGVVTASVGSVQYKKGDRKKSILDRLDFEGMDISEVKVYASRLMESLRNYDILTFNEELLGEAISLINEDPNSLNSAEENVFWILSGYSWKTLNLIRSGEANDEGEDNE